MTNFEALKEAMTPEDLAILFNKLDKKMPCVICSKLGIKKGSCDRRCLTHSAEWLKQEVKS